MAGLSSKMSTVFALCFIIFSCPFGSSADNTFNLPLQHINLWASNFGQTLYETAAKATALNELQIEYLLMKPHIIKNDGNQMVKEIKENIENMLRNKVKAVDKLVNHAEEAYQRHTFDPDIKKEYPKAKKLNTSEFMLMENEHFNFIPVNLTKSTVHVPTNVYDESAEVLNGVDWSEKLDPYFVKNYEDDPTLTWQYFGSATGFFRNYPGTSWRTHTYETEGIDIYDARMRGWYIQAATSPKDVVILLDSSGSMIGQRMEMAKATVEKIIDTLSDDDFFNIIRFNAEIEYVDECFNRTLVQANSNNKKRLKEHIKGLDCKNIAAFDKALIEAFELLKQTKEEGKGAMCNQAIMVVTDGAPENYEDIFKKYNWPSKDVRVFTYLIGRDVGDNKQSKWMACANKGFYSHISTLADVQEKVQEYIHVLSRPMVIKRRYLTTWTSVYIDAAHDIKGLQLMTSVARPVFDLFNETSLDGNLLGIIGTDVPIRELVHLTDKHKLGVNAYAFAITNNGYILFHPDFRPLTPGGKGVKPNYNSVDLSEVELAAHSELEDPEYPLPNYELELRRRMINGETGSEVMVVKTHYDDMRRVTLRENHYFFTDIEDTPFSLGIALPAGYGQYRLEGLRKLHETDLGVLSSSKIKLASWKYCMFDTNETRQDSLEMLIKYLERGKNGEAIFRKKKCNKDLIESLLFDATATSGALASWMKQNRDGTSNDMTTRKNGIELVFLSTKGGLTRYFALTENLTEPHFIEENSNSIEELFYKRAVEGGESIFTFSVPFTGADEEFDLNNTVITGSTPIVISEGGNQSVAAVVGLQMKYASFYDMFMASTLTCNNQSCMTSCPHPTIDCYILDENGYIILSEEPSEVGKLFGSVDGYLWNEIVRNDEEDKYTSKRSAFQKIQLFDFQAVCDIWMTGGSGASSIFINPIKALLTTIFWLFQEIALFVAELNFSSLLQRGATASANTELPELADYMFEDEYDELREHTSESSLIEAVLGKLELIGSDDQKSMWVRQLLGNPEYPSLDNIMLFYFNIKNKYGPRSLGYRACTIEYPLHRVLLRELPLDGTISTCGWCNRVYSVNRIVRTNLLLLVRDTNCHCQTLINYSPREVIYNDTSMCSRLQSEISRKRPDECFAKHELEDTSHCGRGHLSRQSLPLLVLALLFCRYISQLQSSSTQERDFYVSDKTVQWTQ